MTSTIVQVIHAFSRVCVHLFCFQFSYLRDQLLIMYMFLSTLFISVVGF
jgi:hypothetical protein